MSGFEGLNFEARLPASLGFGPLKGPPAGFIPLDARFPNQNPIPGTAPNGIPSNSLITIVVQESPGCYMDTAAPCLYLECTYVGTMTIPVYGGNYAQNCMMMEPSDSNGGWIGSGSSIFQRFQSVIFDSQIADDITEYGVSAFLLYLINYTEEQRFLMSKGLGFNRGYSASTWGAAFNGCDPDSRASMTILQGAVTTAGGAGPGPLGPNTSLGIFGGAGQVPAMPAAINSGDGVFWAVNGSAADGYIPIILQYTQTWNFALHVPGIVGSGNPHMLPLFGGPITLNFWTDSLSNYFKTDFGQEQNTSAANALGSTVLPQYGWTTQGMFINSMVLHTTIYRLELGVFRDVLEQLQALGDPNTFVFKTQSITNSAINLPQGAQGQGTYVIPPRKVSVHSIFILPSPQPTNQFTQAAGGLASGYLCNRWGKYGWVCPNLGGGSCIYANQRQYPEQTFDPYARPADLWWSLLETKKSFGDLGSKPAIAPENFFVMDTLANVTSAFSTDGGYGNMYTNYSMYPNARNTTNNGAPQWRPLFLTTFRQITPAVGTKSVYTGNVLTPTIAAVSAAAANAAPGNGSAFTNPNFANGYAARISTSGVSMTDKTLPYPLWVNFATGGTPLFTFFVEGTSSCSQTNNINGKNSLILPTVSSKPYCNQFIWAWTFDSTSNPDDVAGISTLTGNWFWNINIVNPLSCVYNCQIVLLCSMIVIMNVAQRVAAKRE